MEIVAYRGDLQKNMDGDKYTLNDFIKRLEKRNEIDTVGNVKDLSIALFNGPKIDYRNKNIIEGIKGIGKGDITLVKKKSFLDKGATFKLDAQTDFENHALISSISAEEVYKIFKTSGVHFYHD